MSYTKRDFGIDLTEELDKGFDVVRLSRWAYATHLDHCHELEEGLTDVMMEVIAMQEGPEFEFNEEELRDLAEKLSGVRDFELMKARGLLSWKTLLTGWDHQWVTKAELIAYAVNWLLTNPGEDNMAVILLASAEDLEDEAIHELLVQLSDGS